MSKKKSFSGSTMKLKDFHGGSIPSDLPLPSAPGGSASPSNRVAYDRPMNGAWGMGARLDHHQRPSRPGSAGGSGDSRAFVDDSVPFLPSSARIGRNFEEDERKPFDASFAPRRAATFDPDPLRLRQPDVVDQKQPQQQPELGRPGSSPATVPYHLSAEQGLPSAWNGAPAPSFSVSGGSGPLPAPANVWGTRKDTSNEPRQQIPSTLSSPAASAARFAQASAIDKITSGRWKSKPLYSGQTAGADVVGASEMDAGNARSDESNVAYGLNMSDQRHIDRINALDSGHTGYADGRYSYDWARSAGNLEVKDKNIALGVDSGMTRPKSNEERIGGFSDDIQEGRLGSPPVSQIEGRVSGLHISYPEQRSNGQLVNDRDEQLNGMEKVQLDGRSGGSQGYLQGPTGALERPKLRLLPRSKPLEPSERLTLGGEQGIITSVVDTVRDTVSKTYNNQVQHFNPVDSDDHGQKGSNQVLERPKLNLKPRSLPLEQSAESDEKIRKLVFGGARPRELVLKERGIEVAPDDVGQSLPANSNLEGGKLEGKARTVDSLRRLGEKGDGCAAGRRLGTERKVFRIDNEKTDAGKSYQRNDQRQSARENERSQDERPKHEVSAGPSYGKVASPVQLVQVFSKSISDAHHGNSRLISPKGVSSFSRLTDSREVYSGTNPRKINGF